MPAPQPSPLALKSDNLHVYLAGKHILRGLDFSVHHGELVALLGPNGAGKTTLFRAILGLIPVADGKIQVYGPQGELRGKTAARAIGYVPQRQEFNWGYPLSVENVVMSGLTPHLGIGRRPGKAHWQRVYAALERVKMQDLRKRVIGQLSGGQRQRVLIARALVSAPQVLLLDEPFTGLDQPSMDLLLELFQNLAAEGAALLMSTHDLTGALTSCDRVIMLNRTVRAQGTPRELCRRDLWRETYDVGEESPLLTLIDALSHQYHRHGGLPAPGNPAATGAEEEIQSTAQGIALVNAPKAAGSAIVSAAAVVSLHEHLAHGEEGHHSSLDEHLHGAHTHATPIETAFPAAAAPAEFAPVENSTAASTAPALPVAPPASCPAAPTKGDR